MCNQQRNGSSSIANNIHHCGSPTNGLGENILMFLLLWTTQQPSPNTITIASHVPLLLINCSGHQHEAVHVHKPTIQAAARLERRNLNLRFEPLTLDVSQTCCLSIVANSAKATHAARHRCLHAAAPNHSMLVQLTANGTHTCAFVLK